MTKRFVYATLLIIIGLLLYTPSSFADNGKKQEQQYDIQSAGSGAQGYYLVEVSSYVTKSSQIGEDTVLRDAVHGVLFRGFAGANGSPSQRPLAGSALNEQTHQDFFTEFFKSGGYRSYATFVSGSLKTTRVGKQYKVTGTVSVAKDQLRKDLEKAGVIRSLSSGF